MKKKSLKKVTSAVLVAAMSMGLLAGCGGSKSSEEAKTDADGATVIKFGIHVANPKKQETVTYNIVQGFNKENKGKYKVEFVAADTEAHSKNMKLAAQDGSLPEIVHLDSAEAPEYNEAGYLLDMSDFLKENMLHTHTCLNFQIHQFALTVYQFFLTLFQPTYHEALMSFLPTYRLCSLPI